MTTLWGAPLRRIEVDSGKVRMNSWPFTIPAVRELAENGFEPAPGLTMFIGENGSGKSTLVEAIAAAWARHVRAHRGNVSLAATARPSEEDSNLDRALRLIGTRGGGKGGFFLRAEKMHELFTAVGPEGLWADRFGGVDLHTRSHGQAFLQVLKTRVVDRGLYLFDEPEGALSFTSCFGLVALLAPTLPAHNRSCRRPAASSTGSSTHSSVIGARGCHSLIHPPMRPNSSAALERGWRTIDDRSSGSPDS